MKFKIVVEYEVDLAGDVTAVAVKEMAQKLNRLFNMTVGANGLPGIVRTALLGDDDAEGTYDDRRRKPVSQSN